MQQRTKGAAEDAALDAALSSIKPMLPEGSVIALFVMSPSEEEGQVLLSHIANGPTVEVAKLMRDWSTAFLVDRDAAS